jgi:hypothetical protein
MALIQAREKSEQLKRMLCFYAALHHEAETTEDKVVSIVVGGRVCNRRDEGIRRDEKVKDIRIHLFL